MADIGPTSSRGNQRNLNADVNLVPFIDLLSVCICFLLMTAVWVQLNVLEVKQTHGTDASTAANGYELGLTFLSGDKLKVVLRKAGRIKKRVTIKSKSNEELFTKIGEVAQKFQKIAKGKLNSALLTPHASIDYGQLIKVMDTLRTNKIANLGVVPVGGGG